MAAAIIPIAVAGLGALGPVIADIATPLIKLAQAHFPAVGAGLAKMQTVINGVLAFLEPLGTAGQLPAAPPTAAELQPIIEGILAGLKLTPGALPVPGSGSGTAVPVVAPTVAPVVATSISSTGIKIAQSILAALITEGA